MKVITISFAIMCSCVCPILCKGSSIQPSQAGQSMDQSEHDTPTEPKDLSHSLSTKQWNVDRELLPKDLHFPQVSKLRHGGPHKQVTTHTEKRRTIEKHSKTQELHSYTDQSSKRLTTAIHPDAKMGTSSLAGTKITQTGSTTAKPTEELFTRTAVLEASSVDGRPEMDGGNRKRDTGGAVRKHTNSSSGDETAIKHLSTDIGLDTHPISHVNTDTSLARVWEIFEHFLEKGYYVFNNSHVEDTSSSRAKNSNGPSDDSKYRQNCSGEDPYQCKGFELFDLRQQDCPQNRNTVFTARKGIVRVETLDSSHTNAPFETNNTGSNVSCTWSVVVPEGLHISAAIRFGDTFCKQKLALIIKSATDQENSDYISCHSCCTKNSEIQGKVTRFLNLWPGFKSNKLHFEITSCEQYIKQMVLHYRLKYIKLEGSFCQPICEVRDLNDIQILFMATKQKLWTNLRAVSTSSVSGYVSSPGYPFSPTPLGMNASHTIYLPEGHTMLLSFADVRFNGAKSILKILERREHETVTIYWWRHRKYKDRILMINTSIVVSFTSGYRCVGFKLQFSFHPYNTLPHRLKGHIFNCSVLHYASFKQHLECNLEKECQAGEDEGGHCPFSSEACRGHVNVADKKCYVLYVSKKPLSWLGNQAVCREKGGDMAIVRLKEEMDALLEMLRAAVQSFYVNVGLIVSDGVPNIYRHTPMWIDNTVAYTTPYITSWPYSSNLVHQVTLNVHSLSLEVQNILNDRTGPYLCEHAIQNQSSDPRPVATVTDKVTFNYSKNTTDEKTLQGLLPPLMVCPAGHRTHDFLKCDREAYCLQKQYKLLKCPVSIKSRNTMHTMDNRQKQRSHVFTVAMFQCDRVAQTVPYTLVCNGLPDCLDRSDETFCRHLPCLYYEHRCDNGQCVDVRLRSNIRCDRVTDCYDGSDEAVCPVDNSRGYSTVTVSPPARIDHTHDYFPAATPLESPHTCPQSHFSCPGAFGYCLPIYVRCNSYYDCPNHEDEMGCENYMCPGLYRCRGSIVCLHITHLCDGVVQCQDQDDEVLCEFSCPHNCLCQGLSFLCPNPFPAANFPRLRYLDAAHSSITFHLLQWNSHLVWLSLRDCRLREVSNNTFVNLQYLDLSQNMIEVVTVVFLETLENLKEIRLSENPLVSIIPETFAQCHSGLQRIDLSETRLGKFDCNVFSNFRDVVFLNLSHCDKLSLANIGFQCFPFLKEIDVRGTHILQSKQSMFEGLRVIEFIFSDNYRHCCASVLPKVSRNLFCVVPLTGYSSCSYLLRFSLHRVFLFLSALLSLLGSMFSLLGHHLQGQQHSSSRSTEVFIINLILAVLLTEIYQWIIISGDIRFHGNFLPHERDWTLSASCKTAYFAAFVSTEASCFTCLWISVDRLTALRFPSKRLHFRSACMVCLVVWLTALCLGTAPVLSTASTGNVGTYTSLCIPVALMGDKSGDHAYASGVLVVLNSITALVSAICLTLVYYHVRSHYVIATSSQTSQDMVIARRVMAVVLSDVIYWLGIGFLGIISCIAPSTALSDVMTSMFVVGVPLKSVVSPLLYLNGLVSERRRMAAESRLLLLLERRLRSPPVRGQPSAPQAPLTVRQETSTRSQLMGRLQSKPSSAHKKSQQTVQERQAQRRVDEALSPAQGRKTPSRVESSSVTQPGKSAHGGHIRLPFWEGATSQSARQSGTGSSGFWPPCTSEVEVLGFLKQCLQSDALQTDDVKEMLENLQRQDPPHMRDKLKGNTLQAVDEKDDV